MGLCRYLGRLQLLIVAAAMLAGPAAADTGGLPVRARGAVSYGNAQFTAQLCADGGRAALASLGYRLRRSSSGTLVASHPSRALTVSVVCIPARMGMVYAAEAKATDPDGSQAAKAAQDLASSMRASFATGYEGGKAFIRLKPGLPQAALTSGPINPWISSQSVTFSFPISCDSLWQTGITSGSTFQQKPPLSLRKMPSGASGSLYCDGERGAELLAAGGEANALAIEKELNALATELQGRLPEIAVASPLVNMLATKFTDNRTCLARAAFELGEAGVPIGAFEGGLIRTIEDSTIIVRCLPDGTATVTGAPSKGGSVYDVSAIAESLAAPDRTGTKPLPAAMASLPQTAGLANALLKHEFDGLDCGDAVKSALLFGSTDARSYQFIQESYYEHTPSYFEARRVRFPGRASMLCGEGWASISVAVSGDGATDANADLQRLTGPIATQLRQLRWRADERMGVRLSFPRSARASAELTAQGRPRSLTSLDGGARYVARWIDDPAPSAAEPEAKFAALLSDLQSAGTALRDSRSGFYQSRPSLAVWSNIVGSDGQTLRSVARYVLLADNRIVALEVAYPADTDVAANLGRFSDSLYF